jgi:hypothetical protein
MTDRREVDRDLVGKAIVRVIGIVRHGQIPLTIGAGRMLVKAAPGC